MYIGSWALALQSLSVLPLLFESEPLHPLILSFQRERETGQHWQILEQQYQLLHPDDLILTLCLLILLYRILCHLLCLGILLLCLRLLLLRLLLSLMNLLNLLRLPRILETLGLLLLLVSLMSLVPDALVVLLVNGGKSSISTCKRTA